MWSVIEVTPAYLRRLGLSPKVLLPELQGGWLAFECGDTRRRYAPIPPNWMRMTAEELHAIYERATPVNVTPLIRPDSTEP